MSPETLRALNEALAGFIPGERRIADPLRLLAWGTDASFYRLVPAIAVVVESEDEVRRLFGGMRAAEDAGHLPRGRHQPVRAGHYGLGAHAAGRDWRGCAIGAGGQTVTLQPGLIGAVANRHLAPLGRKIGPDPASIDAAMIGGIAANNASGMCCGTAQNSYHTLDSIRVVLADGTVVDTGDATSRAGFARQRPDLIGALDELRQSVQREWRA